jgi:Domain of unknown function (DUF4352)
MACSLLLTMTVACGGSDDGADHNPGALYPDRANQYREDQERRIGESVMLGGFTATVTEARLDEESGSIVVDVEITNRDEDPQRVDGTQWTLVNPRVQTLDVTTAMLGTTELVGGGTLTGVVTFAVDPGETGDYYIQYKPKILDAARGIWQLTVP